MAEPPSPPPPGPAADSGAAGLRSSRRGLSRRQFIVGAVGAGAAGMAGLALGHRHDPGRPLAAPVAPAPTRPLNPPAAGILVLLTLYGGNDGLNTLIPYQDGHYLGGRGQLGYKPEEVIPLDDTLALHPNLVGFKRLWDAQQLAIVRGVGYPNPNRSHFRSIDIWQSGVPESYEPTGWLGRWLDGTGADPLRSVAIGSALPRAFSGAKATASVVPQGSLSLPVGPLTVAGFADLGATTAADPPLIARAAQANSDLVRAAETIGDLLAAQPASTLQTASQGARPTYGSGDLANQLQLIAKLIKAGLPTTVYGASLGGFDTHVNEKDTHARLWSQVDAAVSGFLADVAGSDHGQRTVVLAYSEFGRRVASNASGGTDHGTAAPVFVAGAPVKGGFYGDEPSITDLDAGDLKFTTDFRAVYGAVLGQILGVDPRQSLGTSIAPIPFL